MENLKQIETTKITSLINGRRLRTTNLSFKVRLNSKRKEVKPHEVIYLQSDINYTFFYFKNNAKQISSFTLKHHIEKFGDTPMFFRISRSIYLNLKTIKSIKNYTILLKNGERFKVSRRRYLGLMKQIANLNKLNNEN